MGNLLVYYKRLLTCDALCCWQISSLQRGVESIGVANQVDFGVSITVSIGDLPHPFSPEQVAVPKLVGGQTLTQLSSYLTVDTITVAIVKTCNLQVLTAYNRICS